MARKGRKHKARDLRRIGENKRGSPMVGSLAHAGYDYKTVAGTAEHLANREAAEIRAMGGSTRKLVRGRRSDVGGRSVMLWFKE